MKPCDNCDHECHCANGDTCCGGQCECTSCEHVHPIEDEVTVDFDPDFSITLH